jgi:3-keto-5-aminohexanoate cleavage enzyme
VLEGFRDPRPLDDLAPKMCSLNVGLLNFFMDGEQVYSAAMLEDLLGLGVLEPPYVINFVLHTPTQGGQRGTAANLVDLAARAERLPVAPGDLRLCVSSMGRTQLPITTIGMGMGLNVRVGMEDNVLWARGEPVRMAPSQARELLGLRCSVRGARA